MTITYNVIAQTWYGDSLIPTKWHRKAAGIIEIKDGFAKWNGNFYRVEEMAVGLGGKCVAIIVRGRHGVDKLYTDTPTPGYSVDEVLTVAKAAIDNWT